jgi:hypothetical protein
MYHCLILAPRPTIYLSHEPPLDYIASNSMMTDECWIGMNMEEYCRCLSKELHIKLTDNFYRDDRYLNRNSRLAPPEYKVTNK